MRKSAILTVWFVAMSLALVGCWNFQFKMAGDRTWTVQDLALAAVNVDGLSVDAENNRLRVVRKSGEKPVSIRLALRGAPEIHGLHFRFHMKAEGVVRGDKEYDSARFVIEWHSADGRDVERSQVCGLMGNDESGDEELVVMAPSGGAIPVVRLEQLGRRGAFELADLEMRPVETRMTWFFGSWLLAAGFLAWSATLARWVGALCWRRGLLGGVVCLIMANQFVIPGPWGLTRPILKVFQLGSDAKAEGSIENGVTFSLPVEKPVQLGKLPGKASPILLIKEVLGGVKQVLHAVLMFGFTLVMAFLVKERSAVILATMIALGIELAQVGFGYGADWLDVWDLVGDFAGIFLAVWVFRRLRGIDVVPKWAQ